MKNAGSSTEGSYFKLMNTNPLNSYVYGWRRERDSVSRASFRFCKLHKPHCQQCQECQRCRGALLVFARWKAPRGLSGSRFRVLEPRRSSPEDRSNPLPGPGSNSTQEGISRYLAALGVYCERVDDFLRLLHSRKRRWRGGFGQKVPQGRLRRDAVRFSLGGTIQ